MKYKNKLVRTLSLLVIILSSCNKEVIVPKEVSVINDELPSSLSIHTEEQKELLESEDPAYLIENNSASFGRMSNSKPLPVSLSWKEENDIDQAADEYVIKISESSDLSNPLIYKAKETTFDVYNLKINTQYYYSVSSNHSGHYFSSEINDFIIEESAPRNLFIEGVENCRDLGGWNIGEGRTYKQGMIYRTAQFNYGGGLNTFISEPTSYGKSVLVDELKIKTDIDLRRTVAFDGEDEVNGISSSPLGNEVKYVSAPMYYGRKNIFTQEENIDSIKLFFSTLADESNYPIAFHCLRGTDRTGALAYVIGALVGMNEEDLLLDYLFSDLANISTPVKKSTIDGDDFYIKGIQNSDGDTLSIKAKNYLMNTVGVSEDTLNKIIDILVEE
ncbi:MAG: tyrosine-protein phosphatase [Bacilli bacterium]|nr:tyrosine-protein phosphatase [Bacilli bacterium]